MLSLETVEPASVSASASLGKHKRAGGGLPADLSDTRA
jgi:hypothetical protein